MKRGHGRAGRSLLLASIVVLTGCATNLSTTFVRDQIAGIVYTENGAPLAGAEIRVNLLRRSVSDDFGRFRLRGITPGEHLLTVSAPGYESAHTTIRLENRTALVRVDLISHAGLADIAIAAIRQEDWHRAAEASVRMAAVDPHDPRTTLVESILRTRGVLSAKEEQ